MRFVLLLHGDEAAEAALTTTQRTSLMGEHIAFATRLRDGGVFVLGEALTPSDGAAVVRPDPTGGTVTDGPFAETKEQLGGIYVIECADRAAALSWAADVPPSPGLIVEVRAVAPM